MCVSACVLGDGVQLVLVESDILTHGVIKT